MASDTTHWNNVKIDYDKVLSTDASNVALLSAAVDQLPSDTADILDIGSGTGRLTSLCRTALPKARIVGVDPAPAMVEEAVAKFAADPLASFQDGVAEDLSAFPDESFDVAISSFALHHLELDTYPKAAAELLRVLRPGGVFINADQFCRVMGPAGSKPRATDVLELLTDKAKYYMREASFERMLLQLDLLPRFLREDGEILTTPEFWRDCLLDAGFDRAEIVATEPEELYNRVIVARKAPRADS
ncbi:class I SAM-dependent methyltransferase [Streptomyces sp. NPDC090052]|uniref:class I SAM-dependent methyltransferase n=1 Tax=unclassified Streptomyces TaxID=2593676 RepID=UPI002258285B|nr:MULTISPECIES: class I SAM-dependent methyltransferase [unclassified Streptomyces]MCX4724077.1 class I SAM-dependent methyltransferase [Streptomyces sp. NBC_01306]WSV06378.1 class I SAM-dependent methyltransferase [Streptomyces sp. NBC_01020]WSX67487.1 class I SAM-dependent methyltransferase [Streptomyces sp. NBC_00932]